MTALSTANKFDWARILGGVGQGLMAAGSPQGWSAFGPAVLNADQAYQQNQLTRQQAEREQARFEEWQRTANIDREERARQQKAWDDYLASMGPGLMQGGTTASNTLGSSLMTPVSQHGGYGAATGGANQPSSINAGAPAPTDTDAQGGPYTPAQLRALELMPIDQRMQFVAQQAFEKPDFERPIEIGGKLVDPRTMQVVGDFSADEIALAQAKRPVTNVNMPGNPSPDEMGRGEFAKANAKAQADYFSSVTTAGAQAQQRLGDVNQPISLIETTPQGAGQEWINKGAALASRFGIDAGEFANVPAAQAFQSIVSRIAPTLRVSGSGATSDFEMQQFLASLPAISNMPDGNRIIANNLKKITERSVQEAYIAAKVQGGELTPSEGRKKILDLGALDLELPSFNSAPPVGGPGGAPTIPSRGSGAPTADDPLRILGQ